MVLNSPDPIRQLEAMRAGVEYRHPVQCRNFSLLLRPLTANENLQVYNAVQSELMKAPAAARNAVHEHVLLAREYLKKASTSDVGQAVGEITDPMLDYMTNDEILHLHKQYLVVMDKCNPSLETMSEQDLVILVDAFKKKKDD